MPSLIDFRRRIRSVKNTQQITKAMKMVSAAKLRRAQERVIAARPYAKTMRELLANLSSAAASAESAESPWLSRREPKRIDLIMISSDTGLAGAFNSNLLKAALKFYDDHPGAEIFLTLVGRKGRDFFRKRPSNIIADYINVLNRPTYADAAGIAKEVIRRFRDGETDAVHVLNNEFKSVMSSRLSVQQVLPLELEEGSAPVAQDYIYEQEPVAMLEQLIPRYVEVAVFRAMLETVASYQAARMTAMDTVKPRLGINKKIKAAKK